MWSEMVMCLFVLLLIELTRYFHFQAIKLNYLPALVQEARDSYQQKENNHDSSSGFDSHVFI